MFKPTVGIATLLMLSIASLAFAGADCPNVSKDKWLSELEMQKKIVNDYGFVIHKFKIDDNCYEIYGAAPKPDDASQWAKIEVYFDPVTGQIVKQRMKD